MRVWAALSPRLARAARFWPMPIPPGDAPGDSASSSPDGQRPAPPITPPLGAPLESPDLTFWAQGVGAWGRINSDGNAADVSRNLGGIFTGFDGRFGEWRAGLAGGYTNASTTMSARAGSANIHS